MVNISLISFFPVLRSLFFFSGSNSLLSSWLGHNFERKNEIRSLLCGPRIRRQSYLHLYEKKDVTLKVEITRKPQKKIL